MKNKKENTSWGGVAPWYNEHLENNTDSYQEKVIYPNISRILDLKKQDRFLDLACGQGFFSNKLFSFGANITGADISKELIAFAKKHNSKINYFVTEADNLSFAKDSSFNKVAIILALQNMENPHLVLKEVSRVLDKNGKLVLVLNHPVFRNPGNTEWGFDPKSNMQYRRIDEYLTSSKSKIVMNPGSKVQNSTISYHHSLQDIFKMLQRADFHVSKLEEWISHKKSERGPRQTTEDRARKEIPLFMMIEATKIS